MKFKVGDRVKILKDNASCAPVFKGDKGTIVEIHGHSFYVKMDINRFIATSESVWSFPERTLKKVNTLTPKQAFELSKKVSSKGPPKMREHTLKEALKMIYNQAKLGYTNGFVDFTDLNKAQKVAKKLKRVGFKVWLRDSYIELEW